MWNLINAPETEIFGIAIALMVLLGVLEVISMLAGGISDWLDNLLPDSLTETAHAEVGLDMADAGIFVRFLSWLYVGRIPVLMLMVVFSCRIRIDGLSVSDGLCHCIRQLSEWHVGSSHRLVSFPALSAGDG